MVSIGNGVDIVENKRINKAIKNSNFIKRVFSEKEIKLSKNYSNKTNFYAKRFAAKEAFYKALGTGIRYGYNFKDVTNLLRRVGLRANVRTNVLIYDTYDVKEGETPEIIAHKLYGDPELHWVVLMVNNVTDRYHDWPMSTPQFLAFVTDKYSDPNATHHYEIAQSSGDETIKINIVCL